jgi:hypothetical protein
MRARHLSLAVAPLLLLLASCGPPWRVIVQSGPPSALTGVTALTMSVDSSALVVNGKPMQQVIAEEPDFPQAVQNMEAGFMTIFTQQAGVPVTPMQTPPGPQEVRVVARFTEVDPGKYAVIYRRNTVLTAHIMFIMNGQVVDEIQTVRQAEASLSQPSIIQRMGIAGRLTGELAAKFFRRAQQGGG